MSDQHNSVRKQISKNLIRVSDFLTKCITSKFEEYNFTDIKKLNTTITIIPINKNDSLEEKLKDKCVETSIPNEFTLDPVMKTETIDLNDYGWSGEYSVDLLNNNEESTNIKNIARMLTDNITYTCDSHEFGNFKYYEEINISYDNSGILYVKINFKSAKMIKKKNFY